MKKKEIKDLMTATEAMWIEESKHYAYMSWRVCKALVEGKVTSDVLQWAEQQYETQKDIFSSPSKGEDKTK